MMFLTSFFSFSFPLFVIPISNRVLSFLLLFSDDSCSLGYVIASPAVGGLVILRNLLISSTARFASFRFLFVSCCASCYARIRYGLLSNAPRTSEREGSVTQLDRDSRDNAAAAAAVSDSRGSNNDSDSTQQ
ncbi:hypothetical protein B0H65DRAFT_336622 [Neurospora tetraspora]|uniref:Uncharacterized protein n=1 Tax=Neurospora tetraspora TaxID=94610 RepID=A0AAE0MJL2_9PEZI|nr:hypothetical protein B0H65DRAFT_336622 [Neurospora tetraspora]